MKGFKRMVVGILILALFMNIRIDALAMNTGFSTENLSEDTKDLFLKNVNLSILYEEPEKSNIECFDVNNSQLIAIGQNRKDRKTICIYSKNGIFQYGYAFNCSGSFGVEWDNENLNIFFVRSSVIASVTPEGEIIDVLLVQDTIENNSYKNHFIDATKRIVDNMEYSMVNNLGILNFLASSHSKIIVKDNSGIETTLYDVSTTQLSDTISNIILIGIFVLAVIISVIFEFIKLRR